MANGYYYNYTKSESTIIQINFLFNFILIYLLKFSIFSLTWINTQLCDIE